MKAKVKFSQQTFKVDNETVLLDSLLKTCMDCYRDFTSTLTHFCTTCDVAYLLGCDNTLKNLYIANKSIISFLFTIANKFTMSKCNML